MSNIGDYFLNQLELRNINLREYNYTDISDHLWQNDSFSNKIKTFIHSNNRRKINIYEADEKILKNLLPEEIYQKQVGIGFITLSDVIKVATGIEIEDLNQKYKQNANNIWVAHMSVINNHMLQLVSGFMINKFYKNFDEGIKEIKINSN